MFTARFLVTIGLYCLTLDTAVGKSFIDGLKPCKKNDPKLDDCLLNMIKQAKTQIIHGSPELKLEPLDPIQIPKIPLHRTTKDIKVSGELTNLEAKGADSINFKSFKVNLDEKTWDMVLNLPLITFVTDFNLNVTLKALQVPVYGKGKCDGKVTRSTVYLTANSDVKNNRLKLEDIKIKLTFGDVEVRILKSQNPGLAQTAAQFFKTNKRMVLDLVTPIAEDVAKDLILKQGNTILSSVKYTDLVTN